MFDRNKYKASILGIPFGTANGRLRKKLVFHLAGKLDMLTCYRCGKLIESLDEFSIEHTESWLRSANPVETFYDVEKIAFSHIACNVGAADHTKLYESEEEQRKAGARRYWAKPEKQEQHNRLRREKRARGVAQSVERRALNPEIAGSRPAAPSTPAPPRY